jgi:hypothetical protein
MLVPLLGWFFTNKDLRNRRGFAGEPIPHVNAHHKQKPETEYFVNFNS